MLPEGQIKKKPKKTAAESYRLKSKVNKKKVPQSFVWK